VGDCYVVKNTTVVAMETSCFGTSLGNPWIPSQIHYFNSLILAGGILHVM